MESQKTSPIKIGALSSFIFIVISYLIFRTDLPKGINIFLYNIVIIIMLEGFSFYGAIFFLGLASFLCLLISLAKDFSYLWNIPIFLATFTLIKNQKEKFLYQNKIIATRIEEIKERANILMDESNRHRVERDSLEKKEARYNFLKDATSIFSSTLSIEEVIKYILDSASSLIGKVDTSLLYLVDTARQELNLIASRLGVASEKIEAKKGDVLDEWVFKQRQGLLIEDIKKDFRFTQDRFLGYKRLFRSVIACPLISERKVIGILRLESSKPYTYTSEDLRLLDILSDLSAVSIQNAKYYKETQDLATVDSLTGLYLRRYFLDRFKEELQRALKGDTPLSLLMIDIDNFKTYNDRFGHTAGDIVLKSISDILKNFVEDSVVSRYGGEEFAILLPETRKAKAKGIAENIRHVIKEKAILLRREETHVTVSIGLATFPEDAKLEEELILKADQRLYSAKREGKDRVA